MNKILRRFFPGFISLVTLLWASSVFSAPVLIKILGYEPTTVSFSFTDGGPQTNTISMSYLENFNAKLVASRSSGDVSGDFPGSVVLSDTSFFNEYQLDLDELVTSGGFTFSFVLNATNNGPGADDFPDGFSITTFSTTTGLPILQTNDPTGANASLVLSIVGGDDITTLSYEIFTQDDSSNLEIRDIDVPAPIPAPGTAGLMFWGVLWIAARHRYLTDLVRRLMSIGCKSHIKRYSAWILGFAILTLAGQSATAAQTDITGSVSVMRSALVLNRTTDTFDARVSIKNTSVDPIYAPLTVQVDAVSLGVTLFNASGLTATGKPFVNVPLLPLGVLGTDQLVSNIVLKFKNPARTAINIRLRVVAEIDVLSPLVEKYKIVPLGDIFRSANAINNAGVIVGTVNRTRRPIEPQYTQTLEAAYLENATLVRLGTLDQADSSAIDINDSGRILGQAFTYVTDPRFGDPFGLVRPFSFGNGVLSALPTDRPDGLTFARNGRINNRGDIVRGQFLYRNDVMTDLAPSFQAAIPIYSSWPRPFVKNMNDSGQILLAFSRNFVSGPSGSRTFEFRTYLYTNGSAVEINPGFEHPFSFGNDLNNLGQVVGGNQAHAYVWQNGLSIDIHSKLTSIDGSNVSSEGKTINNRGQIAGEMFIRGGIDEQHSFFYDSITGRSIRLNRYFPRGTHFQPFDINDKGQILGNIYCTPNDSPCSQLFPIFGSQALLDPLN
jgi:uncharacterized membrane protein